MSWQSHTVLVNLTLDQVLAAVKQLDGAARAQVARVLLETELDTRLGALIRRLAEREPADAISDEIIQDEIDAVRGPDTSG
ncbi:MAG: hypothetical protein HY259_08065 [Chloroflexi bacterium]|nr:hypothetical protein [Chloroflexota bacterium]MBI3733396.1 hypothetical protein [Chloroflexota bacterium]